MTKSTKATTAEATYTLSEKALAIASAEAKLTLQTPAPKVYGKAWREPGHKASNTRVAALATILMACGDSFTADQAQAALTTAKAGGLNLGTGTPRSYVAAFVKNGYFA